MLREMCRTFETPNHNSHKRGVHTQPVGRALAMTLQYVFEWKSTENRRFRRFIGYFEVKAPARRLRMLRELCRTFETPNHNSHKRGLHTQPVGRALGMTLQYVFEWKNTENRRFRRFIGYFTVKAAARRLRMLRELCRTFETPNHNSHKRGLHTQPIGRAYTMTLQYVFE